jgi:transposase InsO family protein
MLLEERRRGDVGIVARALDVTERTIRNWMKGPGGRMGRPARSEDERRRAFRLVVRAWKTLGVRRGWRRVAEALAGALPVRLVQECLSRAKALHAVHERRRIEARRVHVEVLFANVLWHQDAAHLGRTAVAEVQGEVVKDAAVKTEILAASVGGVVTADDAVANVEASVAVAGAAPFVISTDNGPAYKSKAYAACLERHKIVHLKNLPHTPQHNARAERAVRDLKEESGLGRGVRLANVEEAAVRVAAACRHLAQRERLAARAVPLTVPYTDDQRDRLYEALCRRVAAAVQCAGTARARRMAEREAIHAVLEEEGLIERTRGGAPMPATKAEINS